jgi:cytochrome P450
VGLTETELLATAMLVFGAGFETTVNLIGNGAALLFAHPEQRALLAADPSRWANAVDEVLRVESPVQRTARRALRDTTVHGVPVAMREQFLEWGDGAAPSLDMGLDRATAQRVERSLAELESWFRVHLRRLRREPGEDLLSALVGMADSDGVGLTETELLATAMLVFGAGFETTVNLIGNGAALLFAHPEQRALLAADPSLWAGAVDEVLRVESPVQRTARRALRDTAVHGVPVAAGEIVALLLAAANRDPRVFPDPHAFDVTRANARDHVAFSSGIHFCLGAALARMEGEVALAALFERFPDLQPAGRPRRRNTTVLRGYASMPVRLRTAVAPLPG